ncbi:variant 2, AUGMIN subunit 6 [Lathyrus oleraceus]|nr:variant 2, AUGMIN subunit 6 [Pisum sativum]
MLCNASIDNHFIWQKQMMGGSPDILRSAQEGGSSGHAESLAATLAEHQQHLASFQVLINQLKDVAPTIQKSISECTETVNCLTSNLTPHLLNRHHSQSTPPIQAQSSGRMESSTDDVSELTSRMSNVQLDKVSVSPSTLKLPQLFSMTPSSGKLEMCKGGMVMLLKPVKRRTFLLVNLWMLLQITK